MRYQGGNRRDYLKDLASHVFSLLTFSNECHDPHSGKFCQVHSTVHPDVLAASSGGYGIDRWAKEQEMAKTGATYKPYGKNKPLTVTGHLSDRLKDIGLNVSPKQIETLIREQTPIYIQHEHSTRAGQNPVYHYDLPALGFEIGFGVAPDGKITTVIPTGYKLEAHGMQTWKKLGKPPITKHNNARGDAKRAEAKRIVDEKMKNRSA